MAHCSRCGGEIDCSVHVHAVGAVRHPCPLEKGALWVRVLDDKDKGITGVTITVQPSKAGPVISPKNTAEEGLAVFDPLDAADYTVTMSTELPLPAKNTHKAPVKLTKFATVMQGQISSKKFCLVPLKPKIEVIDLHDFLELLAGTKKEQKIAVKNAGDGDLTIKKTTFPQFFPVGPTNALTNGIVLKPGAIVQLEASFAPTKAGDHEEALVIESDDPDCPSKSVKLKGKATQKLVLVAVDKYFAPSVEDLDIKYEIQGFSDSDVVELSILDSSKKELIKRELANGGEKTNGTHDVKWHGKCTDGTFIHPLAGGPYTVLLFHSDPLKDEKPFDVLYHSLHLEKGDWLPKEELDELESHVAGEKPDFAGADMIFCGNVKTIRWTWYQLASQGFYPGPHVTAMSEALGKAIRRFRQSVPKLYKPVFKVNQDKKFLPDPVALAEAAKIDGPLLKYLAAGTYKRLGGDAKPEKLVLTDDTVLIEGGSGKTAKLYADVDRFYYEDEFPDGMMAVHKQWVLPPVICLKATVTLKAKNDDEVRAKHATAVGPIQMKWTWKDRAQVTGSLPVHAPDKPSRVKEYVNKVLTPLAGYEYKNARTTAGGIINGASRSADDNVVFVEHDLYGGGLDGNFRWSGPPKNADKHKLHAGSTLVFFRPSTIGGDNYKITVSVDAGSFKKTQDTGEVELWRRVTVGAYLKWGVVTKPASGKWDELRVHFRHAFLEVVGPERDMDIASLPSAPKALLEREINASHAYNYSHYDKANEKLKFSPDYFFPEDPRSVEFADTPALEHTQAANIVNVLMIDTLATWLQEERNASRAGALSGAKARKGIATVWKTSASGWIRAAGDHFQPAFLALETRNAFPANRKVARVPLDQLRGCSTNRAAILAALFNDVVEPVIRQWRSRVALTSDHQNRLKALAIFLTQVKTAVHSTVFEALSFYRWMIADDAYLVGKTTGTAVSPTHAERDVDIEVLCPDEGTATLVSVALADPLFTITIPAKAKTKVALKFNDVNDEATYNFGTLKTLVKDTHNCGIRVLRGPSADPIPQYFVDDLTDERLDEDARERLWEGERAWVIGRIANALQTPMSAVASVLDSVVRHAGILPEPVPGGTVVICNFATHPHPVPLKVGIPSLDSADYSNPQNICKDGGLILIAAETEMERGHLYAHELAHALFLTHWNNGNENIVTGWSNERAHDLADTNCIMSYSKYDGSYAASHFGKDDFKPEFCGKCNLKLRGWDLTGLPASSRDLRPVFPLPAALAAVATTCPDLKPMHTMLFQMMAELGIVKAAADPDITYPAHGNWIRLYASTATRDNNGVTEYVRAPVAVTQKPSNVTLAATTVPYGHKSDAPKADATLLLEANDVFKASWEDMLYFVYANGGSTNPPSITLNAASLRFYDPGTVLHEALHLYQEFDNIYITEGIVDFLGGMLAHRFEATYRSGIAYGYNPSYLQSTQFVVDELLPRLGLVAAARVFFETAKAGIAPVFRPGAMLKDFEDSIKRGPGGGGNHSYEAVRQLLINPVCYPVPPDVPGTLQADYDAAVVLLHTQIDAFAHALGVAKPSTLGSADAMKRGREKVATMARLKFKFEAWKEQRDEAKRFRSDTASKPEDGNHYLVHRSASFIEEKQKDMHWFNRMFMKCGGADLAP